MAGIERSHVFVTAGYFLAVCSEADGKPPEELGAPTWDHAYAAFFDALGDGRQLGSFKNSLKATRDAFDGWIESPRKGWRAPGDPDLPKPLHAIEEEVMKRWQDRSRIELWHHIAQFVSPSVAELPARSLADLEARGTPDGTAQTEGGRRVRVTAAVERSPGLRAEALRIHGHRCMVCSFSFGEVYGKWGQDFVEVHHRELLSGRSEARETDPAKDLVVLCSNCHRMVHRRRETVLEIDELRSKIDFEALRRWAEAQGRG